MGKLSLSNWKINRALTSISVCFLIVTCYALSRLVQYMVFSIDDSWYLMLLKLLTIGLSMSIVLWLIRMSTYNFYERMLKLVSSAKSKRLSELVRGVAASLVNILFIWLMVQGAIMLASGYSGISPKQLMLWNYQEISFGLVVFGVSLLCYVKCGAKKLF